MDKYFLKTGITIFTMFFLFCGCSTTSGQNPEIEKCEVTPPKELVACTMQWDPVCGCDGITYGNACGARGAGVPSHTPGACEENANN